MSLKKKIPLKMIEHLGSVVSTVGAVAATTKVDDTGIIIDFTGIEAALDTEEARAAAAELVLTSALAAEVTNRTNADAFEVAAAIVREAAIQSDVNQNEADADAAIAALQSDVDQNEADADAAIAALQADVDANEVASDAAEATLTANLASEAVTARAAEVANAAAITAEASTARAAELVNANAITAEAARAGGIEAGLRTDVDAITSGSNVNLDTLLEVVNAYQLADTSVIASITALQGDVDQNELDADSAIATLQADVDQNESDADASFVSATNSRAAIQAELDATQTGAGLEIGGQYVADPAKFYIGSASSLKGADFLLDAALKSEFSARTAADTAMQADIDQNEADADAAIAAETAARIAGDAALAAAASAATAAVRTMNFYKEITVLTQNDVTFAGSHEYIVFEASGNAINNGMENGVQKTKMTTGIAKTGADWLMPDGSGGTFQDFSKMMVYLNGVALQSGSSLTDSDYVLDTSNPAFAVEMKFSEGLLEAGDVIVIWASFV